EPLGAIPRPHGTVEFRVWAPAAGRVDVRIGGETRGLAVEAGGTHAATLRTGPGDYYTYVVDGDRELPDPCSRFQPEGVRGPSCIVDVRRVARMGLDVDDLVIYELHVGTFSE